MQSSASSSCGVGAFVEPVRLLSDVLRTRVGDSRGADGARPRDAAALALGLALACLAFVGGLFSVSLSSDVAGPVVIAEIAAATLSSATEKSGHDKQHQLLQLKQRQFEYSKNFQVTWSNFYTMKNKGFRQFVNDKNASHGVTSRYASETFEDVARFVAQ